MGIIINGQNDTIGPVDNSMSLLGTVSIGGTMTIEDFTNIDSVGLVTARNGVNVTAGDVNLTSGNLALASATPMVVASNGSGHLRLGAGGSEKVRINSNGDVGIGIDNPALRAHIYSTAAADAALIESTQNFATLRFKSALNSSGPTIGIDGAGGLQLDQKDTSKYISFAIGSERLRITSDGKLLIGSDTGSVHGNRLLQVGKTDRSETYVSIVSSTSGESGLLFADTTTNDTGGYRGQIRYHHSDDSMNFRTGASERVRIDSSGNLLLKTGEIDIQGGNKTVKTSAGFLQVGTSGSHYLSLITSGSQRLNITSAGDVNILGGILNLGTADVSSGHINSYELMSFNIDTDNDDGNRYFIFKKDAATAAGTELMRLTEGGNLGIGGVEPSTGDGGNSNYNNWDIPKLHVKGATGSGKFHLLGRFVSGVDADSTGAQIVIHHENDRGMALQGGRSSGNRSYGAIKSLDNLARESNVMVFTGGTGQGVENIKFYTNGGSTGTNERMSINSYGTVHTGGSTEITQSTLKPDLITQAGVVSPIFYRPFQSMSGAPSTSGPGYVDFGTGGVRHNLTDPHLGASYGGSQFQGGLINSYSQTFSNTASGTTREAFNWNRFRILFRGLCLSTGHTPPTVKFRYSTYHYSNGWTDHSGTEWSFNGTEQARGGRWVVGPWINPSSYFTSWSDVPGFGLYYNDNSSGKTFRIAGGVYFQFAHFI